MFPSIPGGDFRKLSTLNKRPLPFWFVLLDVFSFLFNVLVNNFSVILGRSHRFLGIYQYLNLNLNSLMVKRQIDNPSPGAVTGGGGISP